MMKRIFPYGLLALASCAALAQAPSPVAQAVQKAIETNPEVAAKLQAFRAAGDEVGVAAGGWFPHLDTTGTAGRESLTITDLNPRTQSFYTGGARMQLSQLLWDGQATSLEVERLGHAKLLRWFEFVDGTEQTGLDAAKAWYDVVRFRRYVALAEENYVQHKFTQDQVKSRVSAGVGRGVDLEQVFARVALAESNLVTERANLHDVTERYLRIVGSLPPVGDTDGGIVAGPLPATQAAAMEKASDSAAVAAAIENLRAARSAAQGRKSAFQPRIEAQAATADGHNLDGQLFERRNSSAQIVLTWNLFNGGTDSARERQFAHLLDQAADLRDKACNDTRQTAAIAFNDVRKLDEQLVYLDRNVTSIQRARDAYRQQFDIGQRSLLDLLNSENELYTAKRSYAEAEEDRAIAVARVHAAIGDLVRALRLRGPDVSLAPETQRWGQGEDGSAHCPLDPIVVPGASKGELDRRAAALGAQRATGHAGSNDGNATIVGQAPLAAAAPRSSVVAASAPPVIVSPGRVAATPAASSAAMVVPAAHVSSAPIAASAPVVAPDSTHAPQPKAAASAVGVSISPAASAASSATATIGAAAVALRVDDWAAAWAAKDADAYLAFYAPDFTPGHGTHAAWAKERRRKVGKPGSLTVTVRELHARMLDDGKVESTFEQVYLSDNFRDTTQKTVTWAQRDGHWLIVGESNR